MYTQTSFNNSPNYFKTLTKNDSRLSKSAKYLLKIKKNYTNTLFKFHNPVYVSSETGQVLVILTDDPLNPESYEYYILNGSIQIESKIYFNTITLTPESTIYLQAHEKDEVKTVNVKQRITSNNFKREFTIKQVYSMSESVVNSSSPTDINKENYFTLFITTQGDINYHIGTHTIKTHPNQALLVYPNQSGHIEHVAGESAKYISILFDMEGIEHQLSQVAIILNNYDIQIIKDMANVSKQMSHHVEPFDGDKFTVLLYSLLLRILRQEVDKQKSFTSSMKSNYETELFNKMIVFLNEDIESRNEVQCLVEHFELSRSTIQNLFIKYANASPKTYINQIRLNRSKELMQDSSLSISAIAEKLGYGSIQYFSRAFSKEFGMSPSNYAKSLIQ